MVNENICNTWDTFRHNHIEHFISKEEIWYDKLEEVKSFIDIYRKRPCNTITNEEEKVLSRWISNQLTNRAKHQKSMMMEEIRKTWDKFHDDHDKYFKSNEENWYNKLEQAKSFIEINKKKPYERSKDKNEKVLGAWIRTQLTNRRKCKDIMFTEKVRNSWDDFNERMFMTIK